jgi:adenylate cyclase
VKKAEAERTLRIEPTYTIDGTERRVRSFKFPKDAAHYFDGLRKAGLPEQ